MNRVGHMEGRQTVGSRMAAVNAGTCREAALRYAGRGWEVLPLHAPVAGGGCTCRLGVECPKPGKHPRTAHGWKDASSDPEQIRAWWDAHPDANVGIATGEVSGIWVLDVDAQNGGMRELARLEEEHGTLSTTAAVRTGGGGLHLFFTYTKGMKSRCGVLPGIDVRGDGGLVVAPPSLHPSGNRYQWEDR
ncbi:MAG: bifunctional DNA primase/polymerase [Gemmatimonadetes bacterium]|nr:bifunctional DNA primase/polymerase [Gemmatimonadota bacterium]